VPANWLSLGLFLRVEAATFSQSLVASGFYRPGWPPAGYMKFITFDLGWVGRGDQRCSHPPNMAIVLWLADYSDGSLLRLRRRFEKTSVDTQRWAPGDNIRGDRKI
jgi:hypothetical protein